MAIVFGAQMGTGIPEGNVVGAPGSLWIQNDPGPPAVTTVWRKMAATGVDNSGWLRTDLAVLNIRDFGAMCDGSTDDYEAWVATITAAHAIKGIVFHPGATEGASGVSMISDILIVPINSQIQFIGGPGAVIKADGTFPVTPMVPLAPMLRIAGTGAGSRYGAVRDLRFDGGGRAPVGLEINAVQRHFENITIENCVKCGLYIPSAQNCTFISVNCEKNGQDNTTTFPDCNCCLDLGARNNAFFRCQFSAFRTATPAVPQGVYNLVICQSADTPAVAGGAPPSFNSFFGCQIERTSEHESSLGAVLQSAGYFNTFHSTLIQIDNEGASMDGRCAITVNDADSSSEVTHKSMAIRLNDCTLTGASGVVAIRAQSVQATAPSVNNRPTVILSGATLAESFSTFMDVDNYRELEINGPVYQGATTFINPLGPITPDTVADTQEALVVQRALRLDVMPSDATGVPSNYNNEAAWFYDGERQLIHCNVYSGGVNKWRSTDLVQQEIYSTATLTTDTTIAIYNFGIRYHQILIGALTAARTMTIQNPSLAVVGLRITIQVTSTNSSAFAATLNWQSQYKFAGGASLTVPANGFTNMICFEWNGTYWREVSRSLGQPN